MYTMQKTINNNFITTSNINITPRITIVKILYTTKINNKICFFLSSFKLINSSLITKKKISGLKKKNKSPGFN